jgi:hypothetical protein
MRGSRRGSVSIFEGVLAFAGAVVFAALSPGSCGAFSGDSVGMSVPFWVKSEVTSDGEWLAVWRSACFVVDRSIFAADLTRVQP